MHCPFCNFPDTKVIDSRLASDNSQVKRRRECPNCKNRWSTMETADLNLPRVIKKDNSREDFSEKKIEHVGDSLGNLVFLVFFFCSTPTFSIKK